MLSGRARAQAKSGDGLGGHGPHPRSTELKAVLVTADPVLREELAGLNNSEHLRICARLGDDSQDEEDEDGAGAVLRATRITLSLPARRIGQLT